MRRIVICDTGPLLHLTESGAIHLLQLAGEVIIPPIVAKEFGENAPGIRLPDWVHTIDLDTASAKKARDWAKHIHAGESAAIALSLQMQADWLLAASSL